MGYAFGAANALALHAVGTTHVLPALEAAPQARAALWAATGVAIAVFAAQGAASWVEDARHAIAVHAEARAAKSS